MAQATRYSALYQEGINMFVPGMQYSAEVIHRAPVLVSLGTPSAIDADGIHNDLVLNGAVTVTKYASDFVAGTGGIGRYADAKYGRVVQVTPSADPGHAVVVNLWGVDYLQQPIKETITLANGVTTVMYSQNAFWRLDKITSDGAATNAVTGDIGWADRFGVPFAVERPLDATEGGYAMSRNTAYDRIKSAGFAIANAANADVTVLEDGWWCGWYGLYTTGMTTALSAITGFGAPVATARTAFDGTAPIAAIGFQFGPGALPSSSWLRVARGDVVRLTSDGGGTAGVADMEFLFSADGQFDFIGKDTTDPATATTGDPRGLYLPMRAASGAIEYKFRYYPSFDVNASGNGGLHGIKHYTA